MAKTPAIRHRFMIHAEVDALHLGAVLIILGTTEGLENITHELVTDVKRYKSNERIVHETSSMEFVLPWLAEHPTFQINALVKHFEANGRTAGAAYTIARDLVKDKKLIKLGPGNYSDVNVRHIAGPKKGKTKKPKKNGHDTARYEVSNKDTIWNAVKNRKSFKVAEIRALFEREGRVEKSISPQLQILIAEKKIKRGDAIGDYTVTHKYKDTTPAKKKKATTKSPSVTAQATMDATNG